MNIDRIVLTTFPGYFFTQVLSLRSIQQYAAGFPIDIIIDDFGLSHWPSYVEDCKNYLDECFPGNTFTYHLYSQLLGIERVKTGGWFRQQLVKLCLDQIVSGDRWLIVDADVVFREPPLIDTVSATIREDGPVDRGNRLYVRNLLGTDTPWVVNEHEYWCLSSVPFRYFERDLLVDLRQHIERLHNLSLIELHLDMFDKQSLVAYDPTGQTMVMSEFQLLEVFRNRYYKHPLPIGKCIASQFSHSSTKDWHFARSWFDEQLVPVHNYFWERSQKFGEHHV